MKVCIEVAGAGGFSGLTRRDVQKNIDAIQRAIDDNKRIADLSPLIDTKSIMEGIKQQLPEEA